MSKRLNISITKSNVIKIREELEYAQEGYELLEQKREVLVIEVMNLIEKFREFDKEVRCALSSTYETLKETFLILGKKSLEKVRLSATSHGNIQINYRSIMGIILPIIIYYQEDGLYNQYGFVETSYSLDKVVAQFLDCLKKLAQLAQIEICLWRLASELKKTQRKANALNNIFIPEYKNTIKYLEDVLEEKEREELFQLKRVKNKLN